MYDHEHDTYTAPERASDTEQAATAALTSPEYGHSKRVAVTACILVAIFIATCLCFGAALNTLRTRNEHPALRTLRAVLPGGEIVDTFLEVGGSLQFEGMLGAQPIADMAAFANGEAPDRDAQLPSSIFVEFATLLQLNRYGEFHASASLSDINEREFLDLDVLLRTDALQVTSNTLLGDTISLPFEGLSERLESSVFKPGSGSEHELDAATYEGLLEMARAFDPTVEAEPSGTTVGDVQTVLGDALSNVLRAAEGKLTVTREKQNVRLLDRTVKATVYTYSFDENYLFALTDALRTEWSTNRSLEALIREELYASLSKSGESETVVNEAVDAAYAELTTILTVVLEECDKEVVEAAPIEVKVDVAIRSRYLVALSATLATEPADAPRYDGDLPREGATLTLLFSSNPEKDPAFELTLDRYAAGALTDRLSLTQAITDDDAKTTRKLTCTDTTYDRAGNPETEHKLSASFEHRYTGDFMLTVKQTEATATAGVIAADDRKTAFALTLEGTCYVDRLIFELVVDYMELTLPDWYERPVAYTSSELLLYFSVAAGEWMPLPTLTEGGGTDPTILSSEELTALREETAERLDTFKTKFESAIGKDILDIELPW